MAGLGPVATPVPERSMTGAAPPMLPATNSDAVRVRGAVGRKVTWSVQCLPGARVARQSLISEKSPLVSPPGVMARRLSTSAPVLVSWTDCAAPGTPTFRLPKFRLVADNAGACAGEGL